MRVGVDLTFYTGSRGGMETYTRSLYQALAEQQPAAQFVAIATAAGRERVAPWFPGAVRTTRLGGLSAPAWAAAELLAVSSTARQMGLDVLHCPANLAPARSPVPVVLTLHDVNAFSVASDSLLTRGTRWLMARSFRAATAVITDSQWSADEIRRFLPTTATPLTVIPPVGPPPPPDAREGERPAFLGTDASRELVLAGGNRLPHKNWEGLLRALATIPDEHRPLLVITGGSGDDPLAGEVAELGLDADVVLPGWITGAEMAWLYQHAALFVLPSRYEGFGLGVLESMQRGCPVLASDISVLREVGGEAAEYVDSTDATRLGAAIAALLANPARRSELATAGYQQAAKFSVADSARATWSVLVSSAGLSA